ncbi:MAG: DUF4440 domain-containing protein [Actinomycetota bacterium]
MNDQIFLVEIGRLHRFFEDWFNGIADRTIEELADSLDDGFFIVSPDGARTDKGALVEIMRERRGAGPVRIWIEDASVEHFVGDVTIGTYEEHQDRSGKRSCLLSTVALQPNPGAPGGFSWLFVHETRSDRYTETS